MATASKPASAVTALASGHLQVARLKEQLAAAGVEIRQAASASELAQVFRFRYEVYVEEMRRPQKHADHARRLIRDPLDAAAFNVAAWKDGAMVGVVRVNFSSAGPLDGYEAFYAMGSVGADHPARTSITTRLMVAPRHRRSRLPLALAACCFRLGLQHGIRWNFIDCNDHLRRLFLALGYQPHVGPAAHEDYGVVHRLRLCLEDAAHLEKIASPFAEMLREWRASKGGAATPTGADAPMQEGG